MGEYTIKDVIRLNKRAGFHFFDKDTMEFWNSNVESELINNLFVTSEDNFDHTKKLYTVREFDPETYKVGTVGDFQAFEKLEDAMSYIYENC